MYPYFEINNPGLVYAPRGAHSVDVANVDHMEAGYLLAGEWVAVEAGKAVRPPVSGTNGAKPDIDLLLASDLSVLLTANGRTDVMSSLKLTSLNTPGVICRTGVFQQGQSTSRVVGADLVITDAMDVVSEGATLAANGDALLFTAGVNSGTEVAITTANIQGDVFIFAAGTLVDATNDTYQVLRSLDSCADGVITDPVADEIFTGTFAGDLTVIIEAGKNYVLRIATGVDAGDHPFTSANVTSATEITFTNGTLTAAAGPFAAVIYEVIATAATADVTSVDVLSTAAVGFGTPAVGDVLTITSGVDSGATLTLTAGNIQGDVLLYGDATLTGASGVSYQIDSAATAAASFATGEAAVVGLFQHPDTPTVLVCGLVPADATAWPVVAGDGTTPGLIVGRGPTVGVITNGNHRLTGVGRFGDVDVVEFMTR